MSLLFPLGLAALASVLLPLLIHLARRTEQQPMDFAALRWLRHKPRPRHRPRFDEILLLVVRLLLLATIALALARPVLTGGGAAQSVIAIAPGADVPAASDARRIWLAPGFPPIEAQPPAGTMPIGSLIRQLDADVPRGAALTVVVPRILDGADAERPRVSRTVTWRIAGKGRAPPAATPATPLMLRYDPSVPGTRYVAAAVRALGSADIGGATEPFTAKADRGSLIWLATGSLPTAVADYAAAGHTILVGRDTIVPAAPVTAVWRDATAVPLVEGQPLGRGRILRFTRPLTLMAMPQLLEPDFPRRLAAMFATPHEPVRVVASAYTPRPGGPAPAPPARPLSHWIAVAVVALFFIERMLATRAARAPAP